MITNRSRMPLSQPAISEPFVHVAATRWADAPSAVDAFETCAEAALAGGITPRLVISLDESGFLKRFKSASSSTARCSTERREVLEIFYGSDWPTVVDALLVLAPRVEASGSPCDHRSRVEKVDRVLVTFRSP